MNELAVILSAVKYPELVKICLDTAHAYVYGYNLADEQEQENFCELVQKTVGFASIALLHLNDTVQPLGSFLDKHAVIGQGHIGQEALVRFATRPDLAQVPIILELPALSEDQEFEVYRQTREILR